MTVPRPPGAVEAVLAAHPFRPTTAPYGWCLCGRSFGQDAHRAHVAQALVDAGCVLGDDWVVETVEELETRDESGMGLAVPTGRTRTVTTATRTTAWKEAE